MCCCLLVTVHPAPQQKQIEMCRRLPTPAAGSCNSDQDALPPPLGSWTEVPTFFLEERESGLVNGRCRREQSGRLGLGQVALLAATSSFVGFWSN